MSMKYIPVIGLEVHIQSKVKSKMFCSCDSNYFGSEPNTHVCPTCLGLPGALPVANTSAIENCVKLALALHCNINSHSKFDRKHYFYPDLPKGYQISQYDIPFGENGYLEVNGGETSDDNTRIRIKRIHQEEDTAKSVHQNNGTFIDYNKSGVALIEVVTEPDFESSAQVLEFARKLQKILRYLNVSDANMEMGQLRFELNISVKPADSEGYPDYKVECKNISSISILEKVINFEFERQTALLEKGEKPVQATLGIDDVTGETFLQRVKEQAEDYRYFPEPDIPNIVLSEEYILNVKNSLVELPDDKAVRFAKNYELSPETIQLIIDDLNIANWYEATINGINETTKSKFDIPTIAKQTANFLVGELFAILKKKNLLFVDIKLTNEEFSHMLVSLLENDISGGIVKQMLLVYVEEMKDRIPVQEYIEKNGLKQISDESTITPVVETVIQANQKAVEDFKSGKLNAKSSLVGMVMKEFKGKANPQIVDKIVSEKLV